MIQIEIGAMCDPIHKQIGVSEESVAFYQRAVDSMVFLYVRTYLTESDHDKIGRRILKDLKDHVTRQQKENAKS